MALKKQKENIFYTINILDEIKEFIDPRTIAKSGKRNIHTYIVQQTHTHTHIKPAKVHSFVIDHAELCIPYGQRTNKANSGTYTEKSVIGFS